MREQKAKALGIHGRQLVGVEKLEAGELKMGCSVLALGGVLG